MAITLQGKFQLGSSTKLDDWQGFWRFSKDKCSQQRFYYKRTGNVVSPQWIDYISFKSEINPTCAEQVGGSGDSNSIRKRAGRPIKKQNRGRKANTTASASRDSLPTQTESAATANELSAPDTSVTAITNDCSIAVDEAAVSSEPQENNEKGTYALALEQNVNSEDNPIETSALDSIDQAEIELNDTHPLIGVWKGTFAVAQAHGESRDVEEQFFLYSLMTAQRPSELNELPPEPMFPYAIIQSKIRKCTKTNISGLDTDGDIEKKIGDEPCASQNAIDGSSSSSINCSSSDSSSTAIGNSTDAGDGSSSFGSAAIAAAALPAATSENAQIVSNEIDPNVAALAMYAKTNREQLRYCTVLAGFGSNMYGRFSIAAVYDSLTNELHCEKKYLTSKFSAKRGRRSFAECAAVAAAEGHPDPFSVNVAPRPTPPALRQRSTSFAAAYSGYASDDSASGKRKRGSLSNAELEATGGGSHKSKSESKGSKDGERAVQMTAAAERKAAAREAKEAAAASAAAARAAALAGVNETALVGKRNPENDDPSFPYREAFMDCDTGEIYEGGWAYGCRYGRGICIYNDGLMYEGNWVLGKEQGRGALMTGDRRIIYEGDWFDGFMHGSGKFTFGNGDEYTGDWREGTRHGRGEYVFKNGCRYNGEWKDNKRSGKGTFWWPDGGSFFIGDWENDQRHGRGRLQLTSGFSYDGNWTRNQLDGKGVCRFPSGQEYEGTYRNGLREGRGTITFSEGAVYEGRFREDNFDGQGTLKVLNVIPGTDVDELMIPVQMQSEFWRIHLKAGFGNDHH